MLNDGEKKKKKNFFMAFGTFIWSFTTIVAIFSNEICRLCYSFQILSVCLSVYTVS